MRYYLSKTLDSSWLDIILNRLLSDTTRPPSSQVKWTQVVLIWLKSRHRRKKALRQNSKLKHTACAISHRLITSADIHFIFRCPKLYPLNLYWRIFISFSGCTNCSWTKILSVCGGLLVDLSKSSLPRLEICQNLHDWIFRPKSLHTIAIGRIIWLFLLRETA